MILFVVLLVVAVVVLTAVVIALADPKGAAGMFCAGIFKDIYSFFYTEIGTVLSVFKTPDKSKYSGKRVVALALVADVLIEGVPSGLWQWILSALKVVVAAGLFVLAELTKT